MVGMDSGVKLSAARIRELLVPGAVKLDKLFASSGVKGMGGEGAALLLRCAPGITTARVVAGMKEEVSFRGKFVFVNNSGIQGQLEFKDHKKLSKFMLAWACSRGWVGRDGGIGELRGYLDSNRLTFAIWDKYLNSLGADRYLHTRVTVAVSGRFRDINREANIKVEDLIKLADRVYAERSVGWIKLYEYFMTDPRSGDRESELIASAFEDVLFELPSSVWQCFAEFVISNGRWDGFEEAANMVAGALGW